MNGNRRPWTLPKPPSIAAKNIQQLEQQIEEKLRKLTTDIALLKEVRDEIAVLVRDNWEEVEQLRDSFQQHVVCLDEENRSLLKEKLKMEEEMCEAVDSSLKKFYESKDNCCVGLKS